MPACEPWVINRSAANVRTVELSNHPGRLLSMDVVRRERERNLREALQAQALADHAVDLSRLSEQRDRAARRGAPLAWLSAQLALRRARRWGPALAVAAPEAGALSFDRRQQIQAGLRGEQMVAQELARALGREWLCFRGYRNARGEIDLLLLGQRGLIAIEVKHRNGVVHCEQDAWWYAKYDRYGNLVGKGWLQDRAGRSPSEQLNEPADALEAFLARRGQPLPVARLLIFNHPRARLGQLQAPTVHVAADPSGAVALVAGSDRYLSASQCTQAERLIVRDHRFHARRRPAARPTVG